LGKEHLEGSVIFTIARYEKLYQGLMIALSCEDGKELWRWEMPNYSWSSPVDIYDEAGNGYLIQGDSIGKLHLLEGKTGSLLDSLQLNGNIESSPVVFDNYIVIATRGGTVYGVRIK
jgi:outer membrane protein assembly factor BamB